MGSMALGLSCPGSSSALANLYVVAVFFTTLANAWPRHCLAKKQEVKWSHGFDCKIRPEHCVQLRVGDEIVTASTPNEEDPLHGFALSIVQGKVVDVPRSTGVDAPKVKIRIDDKTFTIPCERWLFKLTNTQARCIDEQNESLKTGMQAQISGHVVRKRVVTNVKYNLALVHHYSNTGQLSLSLLPCRMLSRRQCQGRLAKDFTEIDEIRAGDYILYFTGADEANGTASDGVNPIIIRGKSMTLETEEVPKARSGRVSRVLPETSGQSTQVQVIESGNHSSGKLNILQKVSCAEGSLSLFKLELPLHSKRRCLNRVGALFREGDELLYGDEGKPSRIVQIHHDLAVIKDVKIPRFWSIAKCKDLGDGTPGNLLAYRLGVHDSLRTLKLVMVFALALCSFTGAICFRFGRMSAQADWISSMRWPLTMPRFAIYRSGHPAPLSRDHIEFVDVNSWVCMLRMHRR